MALAVAQQQPASAQSPYPQYTWIDSGAGVGYGLPAGANGEILEGDSWNIGCPTEANLNNLFYYTQYYIDSGWGTMTEMSPQSYCDSSISAWEGDEEALAYDLYVNDYVEACNYWQGLENDNEFPGFGFSTSAVDGMNEAVEQDLISLFSGCGGLQNPNVWGQVAFASGGYTQTDYDDYKAPGSNYILMTPQVYNSFMAGLANNAYTNGSQDSAMVTFYNNPSLQYSSESESVDAVSAPDYCLSLNNEPCAYWANEFVPG